MPRDILVCRAIGESPKLPGCASFIDTCAQCNTHVWRAYSSPKTAHVICNACFSKARDAGEVIIIEPPNAQQLLDILSQSHASRN